MNQSYWMLKLRIWGLLVIPFVSIAQQKPNTTDQFHDYFFESLKFKGVENYDKALLSLQKCKAIFPNDAVIYYEIARNHYFLKEYHQAQQAYKESMRLDASNQWSLKGLYDVYYDSKDFNAAIDVVTQLIESDNRYREDLVSLYMETQQYDKAIALIKILDKEEGLTTQRNTYKSQIYSRSKYHDSEKEFLEKQIKKNPELESNYISLIYLYSESNQEEKAFEVAELLQKNIPESQWAQVGLFKFYLNKGSIDAAIIAMHKSMQSDKINQEVKKKIIKEFLIYNGEDLSNNQQIIKSIELLNNSKDQLDLNQLVGVFYSKKGHYKLAVFHLEKVLKQDQNLLDSRLVLLRTYLKINEFDKLLKVADNGLDLFPLQPELYYLAGLASNELNVFSKAKQYLEEGMDYVVENESLLSSFKEQIVVACKALNNEKCVLKYEEK